MEVRIDRKKLLFYHHIWNLPDNSLAKIIAINQVKLNYPGLMTECKLLLVKYNLPEWENHTKLQWKKIVDKALKEYNKRTLLEKIKMYKKMEFEKLSKEDYEMKKYLASLNIADARLKFALRTCMTKTIQANYKGDPDFRANNWKCQECQVLDTQDHVVRCPVYLNLRTGKDLENDKDLVEYFRKVINIRSIDN